MILSWLENTSTAALAMEKNTIVKKWWSTTTTVKEKFDEAVRTLDSCQNIRKLSEYQLVALKLLLISKIHLFASVR